MRAHAPARAVAGRPAHRRGREPNGGRKSGAGGGTRTLDLLFTKQLLYH